MEMSLIAGMPEVIAYIRSQDERIKALKAENEKLKAYKEYFDTWSPILRDVDGDDLCNLLSDYGWVYDDDGKLVNVSKEEKYQIEINVVGLGWCRYVDEEDRDKHVVYCKNGFWKIKGDKTAKDDEGNYCETDDEED